MVINKELQELISNEINGLGFSLFGLELEGQGHNKLLRVYADLLNNDDNCISNQENNPDLAIDIAKGITIEDCSKINRHLRRFMSTLTNSIARGYVLEVSSPGVERRLFNLSQFITQIGKEIKVRLRTPLDGKSKFSGLLQEVDLKLNKVFVEVDKQQICLDYDNIAKANLVYPNCN